VPPSWTDASEHDPGVTLLELLAYADEMLSSYQDRLAEEQRLRTRGLVTFTVAALLILIFWRRRRPDEG
jgi:hypothetical protein